MRYLATLLMALLVPILLARPASTAAAPSLAVSPAAGPPGTPFTVTGHGLNGTTTIHVIVFYLARTASGGHGQADVLEQLVSVGADGRFALQVDSTSYTPETYHVVVPEAGSMVGASFVVTSGTGTLPGMPNTGGGGMRTGTPVASAGAGAAGCVAMKARCLSPAFATGARLLAACVHLACLPGSSFVQLGRRGRGCR